LKNTIAALIIGNNTRRDMSLAVPSVNELKMSRVITLVRKSPIKLP